MTKKPWAAEVPLPTTAALDGGQGSNGGNGDKWLKPAGRGPECPCGEPWWAVGCHQLYPSRAGPQCGRGTVSGAGKQQRSWEVTPDWASQTHPSHTSPCPQLGPTALGPPAHHACRRDRGIHTAQHAVLKTEEHHLEITKKANSKIFSGKKAAAIVHSAVLLF